MTTLSIIVPALDSHAALETTLLAILPQRPAQAEIIVVDPHRYPDPYGLREEVRFVSAPPAADPVRCLELGFQAARGEVLHWLPAGAEVEDGWTGDAVARFEAEQVAAVLPRAIPVDGEPGPYGWATNSAGTVCEAGRWSTSCTAGASRPQDGWRWGPRTETGFVRRAALLEYGSLPATLADLALLDFALWGADRGRATVYAPGSTVRLPQSPTQKRIDPAHRAAADERLFWRNLPHEGWIGSSLTHALRTVCAALNPLAGRSFAARLAAWCAVAEHRRHYFESRRPRTPISVVPAPHFALAARGAVSR